jgi:hypothetical protein
LNRIGPLALLLALSCNEGYDEFKYPQDLATVGDDLGASDDMSVSPDLNGPTCGQILMCMIGQCMLTNLTCDQMCAAGAPTSQITAAGALAFCAAQHCLGGDGGAGLGGGVNLGLFLCIAQNCQMQLANCPGLSLGGPGG